MKHYCEKCGAELDKNTGLCPNCDGDELVPMEDLEEIEEKKITKRGITAIFIGIISILIVVTVIIIAVLNGWIGGSDQRSAAIESYKTYFNETLYRNYGVLDTKHPYITGTGMFFADTFDLSGDKSDSLVVGIAEKTGDKIEYNLYCYDYNPNNVVRRTNSEGEINSGVELNTAVDVFDENNFIENPSQHSRDKFQFYRVEYKDKDYIFAERVHGKKWYCKVYTMNKGAFAEVESISIDNYKKGKNKVEKFFKQYKVKKTVITNDKNKFTLTKQKQKNMIFSYSYTPKNSSQESEDDYNLKDYSDLQSFLSSKNKAEVKSQQTKNEKTVKKKTAASSDTVFSEVVKSGSYTYYWKYNSGSFSSRSSSTDGYSVRSGAKNELIKRSSDGEETVILQTAGVGKIAIAGGRIFFQRANGNSRNYNVDSCDLNGNDLTYHDRGVLEGVVQGGDYVVYSPERTNYEFGTIKAIRVQDLERITTVYNARFVACDNERVYYQSEQAEYSDAHHGKTTLASVYANGSASRTLYVTQSNLYKNESNYNHTVSLIRNAYIQGDYIYYAYGSYMSSDDSFMGGNIVRAKLDGSSGEVLQSSGEDDFAVNSSGEIVTGASMTEFAYNNGAAFRFNPKTGENEEIISAQDYSSFTAAKLGALAGNENDGETESTTSDSETDSGSDDAQTDETRTDEYAELKYAVSIDGKIYFLVAAQTETRRGSAIDSCALFEKDTKEGETRLVYSTLDDSSSSSESYSSYD